MIKEWDRGYVQVYTGDGKGKTTAALGLALRAAGAGLHTFIAQFVKGMEYSELRALKRFPEVEIRRYGRACFIDREPQPEDIDAARTGLREAHEQLVSREWDIVVLDEANIATHYGLFPVEELLKMVEDKPEDLELVITGRCADHRVLEAADLVTEMREVKHYYERGVGCRKGIEN